MPRWSPLLLLLALAADTGAEDGSGDPERRFLEAWFLLEDPERRDRAGELFRALIDDEDAPLDLRIRAEVGLARADELAGRNADARRRLEGLIPRTADLPALRRVVAERLGQPRWFHAIRTVTNYFMAPRYLDLDTGGLLHGPEPHPRGGPEMNGTTFLVKTEIDREFGEAVPPMSTKPWHRLRTDEGNLCWVQILATSPQPVVRFITRVGGYGEVLPAPREPFCIGYNSKIEVWWHTDPMYVKYRVERRNGPEQPWTRVKDFERPPFIDRAVRVGERYGYRVTGVTKDEVAGLPVRLQGTVRSRGVTSGRVELRNGEKFDFLTGDTVNKGYDIRLQNVWQQQAMIYTHLNSPVHTLSIAPGIAEPRSPWDAPGGGNQQVKAGDVFMVPLNGGGVARCKLTVERTQNNRRFTAILDYEAFGDADIFPEPPTIETEEVEDGIRIRAAVKPPYRLAQAEVREIVAKRGPWVIPLDENGVGLDTRISSHDLREYTVVAVDAHGRRTLPGRVVVNRMADKPIEGEFKFRFQQGYSIAEKKHAAMPEADIFFQHAQRNLDRISLYSTRGVATVRAALQFDHSSLTEEQIFERIAGVDPGKLTLTRGLVQTNQSNKGDNILIVRTKHGGWAKVWIADRGKGGRWNMRDITMRYVYNARAPRFEKGGTDVTEKNGVLFSGLRRIEEYTKVAGKWRDEWSELYRDAGFRRRMETIEPAGGAAADPDELQEVLVGKAAGGSAETARYSFSLGRRDPPESGAPAGAWDVQWEAGRFSALHAGEQRWTLTDLGRLHWLRLTEERQLVPADADSAVARFGHVYLLRKRDGGGAVTLFRVVGLDPGKRVQIEWVSLRDGKLRVSPAIGIDVATQGRLQRLLAAAPQGAAAAKEALGGEAAHDVFVRLHRKKIPSVARREIGVAALVGEFEIVADLQFVLEGDVGNRKFPLYRPKGRAVELLHEIADAADLAWRIDGNGKIRLRPLVLTEAEKRELAEAEKRRGRRMEEERRRREEERRKKRLEELAPVRDALKQAIAELEGER